MGMCASQGVPCPEVWAHAEGSDSAFRQLSLPDTSHTSWHTQLLLVLLMMTCNTAMPPQGIPEWMLLVSGVERAVSFLLGGGTIPDNRSCKGNDHICECFSIDHDRCVNYVFGWVTDTAGALPGSLASVKASPPENFQFCQWRYRITQGEGVCFYGLDPSRNAADQPEHGASWAM